MNTNYSKVSLMAFLLGIFSVMSALIIGNTAFQSSVRAFEHRYQQFYLREAKILVKIAQAQNQSDDQTLLKHIEAIWRDFSQK